MRIRRCFSAASSQTTREEDWPVGILLIVGIICSSGLKYVLGVCVSECRRQVVEIGSEEGREISEKVVKTDSEKVERSKEVARFKVASSDAACVDVCNFQSFDYFPFLSTLRSMI